MCLGSLDLRNVRKIRSALDGCISDLINNHREILCKAPSKDFTRSCFFSAEKVLNTLLRFGAKNSEKVLEFENFSDPLDTDESATESSDENEKTIGTAFSQAVTACRQLLVKHPLKFIKDAIKIIKGHTFAIRSNREFERKVKSQSNRPFGYKTS